MTQLVLRRLEGMRLDEVFALSSSEWDRVLHYSAGNFGALARLLSHAFEIAGMSSKERVDRRCFELALRRLRAELGMFVQQHRALLLRVREHQLAAAELPGGRAKGVAADAVV